MGQQIIQSSEGQIGPARMQRVVVAALGLLMVLGCKPNRETDMLASTPLATPVEEVAPSLTVSPVETAEEMLNAYFQSLPTGVRFTSFLSSRATPDLKASLEKAQTEAKARGESLFAADPVLASAEYESPIIRDAVLESAAGETALVRITFGDAIAAPTGADILVELTRTADGYKISDITDPTGDTLTAKIRAYVDRLSEETH